MGHLAGIASLYYIDWPQISGFPMPSLFVFLRAIQLIWFFGLTRVLDCQFLGDSLHQLVRNHVVIDRVKLLQDGGQSIGILEESRFTEGRV
jgi:hypothetical protein